jgi:hypothetical protein
MSWEPIDPKKPDENELIGDEAFDVRLRSLPDRKVLKHLIPPGALRNPDLATHIANQEEHHRKVSFKEELIAFLKRHEITCDEKYLWE